MHASCWEEPGSARVSRDWFRRRAERIFHCVIYLPVAVVQEKFAIATRSLPRVPDERPRYSEHDRSITPTSPPPSKGAGSNDTEAVRTQPKAADAWAVDRVASNAAYFPACRFVRADQARVPARK